MFLLDDDHYAVKKTRRKGRGVFAKRSIPDGTVVGDYLGRIIKDEELDALEKKNGGACYSMDYAGNGTSIYPLDVTAPDVHLINHSCAPNCGIASLFGHTIIFALRRILPGEEFSFDYGFDPAGTEPVFSYPCHCGSPICRGTMYTSEERINLYGEYIKRTTKGQKFRVRRVGSILGPLDKYPAQIKDDNFYDLFVDPARRAITFQEKRLPALSELRRRLRKEGRPLAFQRLGATVWGIQSGQVLVRKGRVAN